MGFFFKFLLLFSLFFNSFLYASTKTFKVSYDPDFAPFSYLENNKLEGLLIDYWKTWAEKNNYELKFINGKHWDNAINLVKEGEVDFFLGAQPYKKWMHSSKTYYKTDTSLFIHKDNSTGFTKDAHYIIGVIGESYQKYVQEQFSQSEVVIYETYQSIFEDLISKKIDLIYDDKIAIEYYALRNDYFHEIRSIGLLNSLALVKVIAKDKELIKIFNEGFEKLSNEELYEIESKWIINEDERFYKTKALNLTKEEKEFIKKHKVMIANSRAWKPFNFDVKNIPSGISYEIWELISRKANINSNYTFFNIFTNQLNSIKEKKQDIIYSVGETKERKEYAIFSTPYYSFPLSIATLKDEDFIENIKFLLDKKVAVGKNFTSHKLIKEKYPSMNFLLVDNIKEGLEAVAQGKAYAFVDLKPSLSYNIRKHGFDDLKITGNTGLKVDLAIMIRDDLPLLKSILDKTISSLNQDEIEKIINKWSNIQFEKTFDYGKLWLILFISFILISVLIYKEFITSKRNRKLESLVDERTSDLKKLNETLEQIVEDKTKELKKVNHVLDEAQKITNLGSFQFDIKKDTLIFSDEFYKILEIEKTDEAASFHMVLNLVHEEDKERVLEILEKTIQSKRNVRLEFRLVINGKTKYIQSTSKIAKFDEDEQPIIFMGTILDISKIKNLEKEKREKESILAQQAKMAAMGEMLENIAHQWRQPLSVISTASTGMQIKLELGQDIDKKDVLENIITVNKQAQYLSKTIEDFRNFFNPNKLKLEFNVRKSIKQALYLMKPKLTSKNVVLVKNLDDVNIFTLENELIQVLLNIFNNAIDAFENKNSANYIFVNAYEENSQLIIEIKDNAGGVNPKIINRIFEPYFTTKHKSQGTGIGLYMSNEIITKHLHGSLNVTNKSYNYDNIKYLGASFTITMPLNAKRS